MLLPRLGRALFALAMVLGTSSAVFAGTSPIRDVDPQSFEIGPTAAPFGCSAEPSLHAGAADLDTDADLDAPGEEITALWSAPSRHQVDVLATVNARPFRPPCGFPSVSRPPPVSEPIV